MIKMETEMEMEMETSVTPLMVPSKDKTIAKLCQVTVSTDEEISKVNQLITDGWRVMSIGYHADATVYVLARTEDKPRHRPGFLSAD
jgi:hypothetical protein